MIGNIQKGDGIDLICDGCSLPFKDRTVIIFSNSVIEHVGSQEKQMRFAFEVRRASKGYWVQTPNKYFPVEPHTMFPLFQFLPRLCRKVILDRWVRPVLWGGRINKNAYDSFFDIRLLSYRDLQRLFPDGEIFKEKVFGVTKSFIVSRKENK